MGAYLVLFLLGFGPSLIWLYWLWSRDRFQREPLGLVLKLMVAGSILSVGLTLLTVPYVERALVGWSDSLSMAMLLTAGLPEELFKLLPVLLIAWRSPEWNEPFDGIMYAGASALGFHLTETLTYMAGALHTGLAEALWQALLRGAKPGHMLYGVAMGYFLSLGRFAHNPWRRLGNYALALLVPVGLHTAWDIAAGAGGMLVAGDTLGRLVTSLAAWGLSVGLWATAFHYLRQGRSESPWAPDAGLVAAAPLPCAACGADYPLAAHYCPTCGKALESAAPSVQEQPVIRLR